MNDSLHALMQKEMTRKEFLGVLGVIIASILGITSVLRILGIKEPLHAQLGSYTGRAYGK